MRLRGNPDRLALVPLHPSHPLRGRHYFMKGALLFETKNRVLRSPHDLCAECVKIASLAIWKTDIFRDVYDRIRYTYFTSSYRTVEMFVAREEMENRESSGTIHHAAMKIRLNCRLTFDLWEPRFCRGRPPKASSIDFIHYYCVLSFRAGATGGSPKGLQDAGASVGDTREVHEQFQAEFPLDHVEILAQYRQEAAHHGRRGSS